MKYNWHYLPLGRVPVPTDDDGDMQIGDWRFYYKGSGGSNICEGMLRNNTEQRIFPRSRWGILIKSY